jgi:hypothetical protein
MDLFHKKTAFEKQREAEIKAAKEEARDAKKDARKEARDEKQDARQDARAEKKDARQDARADKKDARQDKRDAMKDIRQSDLKGSAKRDAKKDVRDEKHDTIDVANQEKKDDKYNAREDKRDRIDTAQSDKKKTLEQIRKEKQAILADLKIPRAADRKWVSYLRFQEVKALEVFKPKTLGELQTICRIATDNDLRVRAVGSGHSFSEVAITQDILVETHGYNRILPFATAQRSARLKTQYQDAKSNPMAEVEVGITVFDLSKELEKSGHALLNQGTYDGQTLWGATSTSTHGTGFKRGPFPSMIRSLVLVGEAGRTFRIEPADGITRPQGWKEPGIDELIQDDDTFYSVVCSFGSMGIVYSAVIEVREFYWIDEWTFITTWDTIKAAFPTSTDFQAFVESVEMVSFLVSPNKASHGKKDGVTLADEFPVSMTIRRKTDQRRTIGAHVLDGLAKIFEDLNIITGKAPAEGRWFLPDMTTLHRDDSWLANFTVKHTGKRGWEGDAVDLDALPIKRRNKCYKIFPLGGKLFGGYALELGFPIARSVEIMDRIIDLVAMNDKDKMFHSAPVSLRFVAPTEAYASPMYRRPTVMFEVLMSKGTKDGEKALMLIEESLMTDPDLRLHWGLNFDRMRTDIINLQERYPKWDKFLATFRRFNAKGTFTNSFTKRIGMTP